MPEVSRFYGIVIGIFYNDHAPPHFHAVYGEHRAKIDIASGNVIEGKLPRRAFALVSEWRMLRLDALDAAWREAQARRPFRKIAPLE